jgi:hypothetical protein
MKRATVDATQARMRAKITVTICASEIKVEVQGICRCETEEREWGKQGRVMEEVEGRGGWGTR